MGKIIWIESAQNYPKYISPRIWIGYKTKGGKVTGIGLSPMAWFVVVLFLSMII